MTLTRRQWWLTGLSIFFCVVSFFFLPKAVQSLDPFWDANSKLLASSDKLWLESYLTCFLVQPQCRLAYGTILRGGSPFPFELAMLFLFSGGSLLILSLMHRQAKQLYDSLLATLKDMKDLLTRFWLTNPRAGKGIITGRHVTVPDAGEPRKRVLRGHSRRGIDGRMMIIKPGYGGRSELPLGAVFGTTRSGKTMHLIAQALRWTDSFIALDVKGEIYELTGGTAAKRAGKHRVIVLSPEGQGNQFDPLAELLSSDNGISTAANIIAAPDKETGHGRYFAEKAAQGLEAAFYAARYIGCPPFDFLYGLVLAGGMGSFYDRLSAMDDPQVQLALNKFLDPHGGKDFDLQRALNESSLTNSWSTMIKSLSPFLSENVRWLLRRCDFRAQDLMEKPTYVYLQFPETTLEATSRVYDLIVTGLTRGMFDYVSKDLKGQKPPTRVLLLLDELYAAPVSDLPQIYSTAAGRHIIPIIYCQSLRQLDEHYGETGRVTILDNCGVTLYYKTESWEMAKHISQLSGKVSRTEQRKSRRWRPIPTLEAPTISEGNQSREVLTPEEVMTMGGEKREVIAVHVTGKPLAIARRVDPYKTQRLNQLMKKYSAPEIHIPEVEALANYTLEQTLKSQNSNRRRSFGGVAKGKPKPNPEGQKQQKDELVDTLPVVTTKNSGTDSVVTSLETREKNLLVKNLEEGQNPDGLPRKTRLDKVEQPSFNFEAASASPTLNLPTSNVKSVEANTKKAPLTSGKKIRYRGTVQKVKNQKESSS